MQKIWNIKKENPALQKTFSKELGVSCIIAQLLINRGIADLKSAEDFLNPSLNSLLDPYLLVDMDKAVERIKKAISKGEKIAIYGDYDADGITSVAVLARVLKKLGANVITYIPHRINEGYGINQNAVKALAHKNIKLLISVDCGINAKEEIDYLKKLHIDSIVVDHHRIQKENYPKSAIAVINPLREDCRHSFRSLAAVGLVFKLVWALLGKRVLAEEYLDLVSIGTVSDVVAMLGENRILTKFGLPKLKATKNIGIKSLMKAASLKAESLTTTHIGFILGPRINAAGRLSSPDYALQMLLTEDIQEAEELAKKLNLENRTRQNIEDKILKEALLQIDATVNFKDHRVIVLENASWHPGVIGIVASRIVDRFYRPTVMIALDDIKGKGSARSIKDFHLFDAISKCSHFLEGFGGHANACGITIKKDFIENFRNHLNVVAKDVLTPDHLVPKLDIDMNVPLKNITESVIADLINLAPFGIGNPKPLFATSKLKLKSSPRRINRNGVKMWVTDGKMTYEAIAFGASAEFTPEKDSVFNLAYTPSMNSWQGIDTIQLELKDIKEF